MCVCVCVCAYKTFLELIIQKYFLNEPWEFPSSLKTLHVPGTQSCEEIEELTEPLQLLVIKMIEATCQHKSALCTVINNTEHCPL